MFTLRRRQVIRRPADEVVRFFEEAANLERITPPWLRFRIEAPPPDPLERGSHILYRLRLWGFPVRWRTRIERFDPGHGFVDVQVEGPYTTWIHTHVFTEGPEGVIMEDRVDYELPFGPLGRVAQPVIAAQLWSIFRYRRRRVERLFPETGVGPPA